MEALVLEDSYAPVHGVPGLSDLDSLMPVPAHRECGGGAIRLLVRPGCPEAAWETLEPRRMRAGAADAG